MIQELFYQSLADKTHSNNYHSFNISSVINNNENTSSILNPNISDKIGCEFEDNIKIDEKALKLIPIF